jgi:hypothetical protein
MRRHRRIPIEALIAVALALVLGCSGPSLAAPALVYQCERDGVRVFSDRPCGTDARPQPVQVDQSATHAVATPPASKAKQAARASPAHAAPAPTAATTGARSKAAQCHGIQDDIDALDTRMRLGYRGKQGVKLQARRDAATERYRALRCNTTAVRPRPSAR